ncbi:Terminase small subunit [uncultured Caudovirales phage]|uniref:Terminase small subunit n=1 Tax=uncultured Caudovirales phage TaxID=2100421 RepID=A0A6J5LBT5_9CAUD|nr:Terminase small subunit [uncultured Caudovirales phage]
MIPLTAKQEAFCQNIVDGCTQLEAYRRAYDSEKMTDNSISCAAYQLMNNSRITHRIQQLRDLLAERLLFPRIERLEILKGIAQSGERDGDRINSIKVFSEMIGDNAPQKIVIDHSGTIETTKSLEQLTDDELANIASSGSE